MDTNEGIVLIEGSIEGCGVLDVTIDGNSVANTSNGGLHGIAVRQATDVVIRRVRIKNIGAAADGTGSNNDGISIGLRVPRVRGSGSRTATSQTRLRTGSRSPTGSTSTSGTTCIYQNGSAMDNGILGYNGQLFRNILYPG